MVKKMEKGNYIIMRNQNMKVNFGMERKMEKEKNIIFLIIHGTKVLKYYSKVNI